MTILESLILRIKAVVNSNGTQAIRGDNLQNTLVDIAQTVDAHFAYKNGDPNEDFTAKDAEVTNVTGINATFENIVATQGITAPMFTVRMMAATGGIDITSAANAKLTNVVDGDDYWQCFYKCAGQLWKPLDQARIQSEFGGFLWGLVTAASEQPNDRGEYSFNISKTTVANGSNATPKLDDVVVLYGHRGADKCRQSLFIKSCGVDNPDEDYEPYEAKYVAIDSFSLPKSKCTKWDGLTFDIAVNSFAIRGRDGNLYQQPNDRGSHVAGTTYYAFDRVSRDGSVWQCVADSTTAAPSDDASDWVCVVLKGGKGDAGGKGDYLVQGYQWAEDKPARPVGSSPEGWSAGSDRGVAIVDGDSANSPASDSTEAGYLLTDESGAVLLDPYPASYRLWGSTATFDAETGEVVGEWSDPYQMTAEDGKDGQDGKDVDPAVVDALQAEIDAAKEAAKQAKLDALKALVNDSDRVDDIERFLDEDAPFEIRENKLGKMQTFIRDAYIDSLVTSDAFIANLNTINFEAQNATVGKLTTKVTEGQYITAQDNYIAICSKSDTGAPDMANVTIKGGAVPSLAQFEGDGASGAMTYNGTIGGSQSVEVWPLGALNSGTSVNVKTTLQASFFREIPQINMPARYGWISIWLMRGDTVVEELARCMYPATAGNNVLDVNRTAVVEAGVYSIVVAASSSDGSILSSNTSPIVMSYTFLDNSRMSAFIGDNGFVLRGNFVNYFHLSFLGNQMSLKAKGNINLPGVLAKARVMSNGAIVKAWGSIGIVSATPVAGQAYNWKIKHTYKKETYSAFVCPFGTGTSARVIDELAEWVYVNANGPFNIELTGDNG